MKEYKIGDIISKEEFNDASIFCNRNGQMSIEYKNSKYIIVAKIDPEPSLEEQLTKLEKDYNMPRVIREGILGNPSMYSEFNVLRAKELEELAKKIRDLKEGK